MISNRIKSAIREVPDFPTHGINFKDITTLLKDWELCEEITSEIASKFEHLKLDAIAGIESRGFLFGMMIANRLKIPFITIRKKGKLPYNTVSYRYDLEYGSAEIEMHTDAIEKNWNILIHDDLLATGGTAAATAELIKQQEGNISGFAFLVELPFLGGKEKLEIYSDNCVSLVKY